MLHVGDRVKIVSDKLISYKGMVGKIVTAGLSDTFPYLVKLDNYPEDTLWREGELELIEVAWGSDESIEAREDGEILGTPDGMAEGCPEAQIAFLEYKLDKAMDKVEFLEERFLKTLENMETLALIVEKVVKNYPPVDEKCDDGDDWGDEDEYDFNDEDKCYGCLNDCAACPQDRIVEPIVANDGVAIPIRFPNESIAKSWIEANS